MDKEVILEKFRFYLASYIPDDLAGGMEDVVIREMTERFGYQVSLAFSVAGERMDWRTWPKTWWDAFKERWYPQWALRRWPPVYERIEVNAYYPLVSLPQEKNVVKIVDIR